MTRAEIFALGTSLDALLTLQPGASVVVELARPELPRVAYLGGTLWVWRLGRLLYSAPTARGEVGPSVVAALLSATATDGDLACLAARLVDDDAQLDDAQGEARRIIDEHRGGLTGGQDARLPGAGQRGR